MICIVLGLSYVYSIYHIVGINAQGVWNQFIEWTLLTSSYFQDCVTRMYAVSLEVSKTYFLSAITLFLFNRVKRVT